MSRQVKDPDEFTNTFIDERVNHLLPLFEALAPYKLTQRKKGVGDLPGWERLAAQEARILKTTYPDEQPEAERQYNTALRQITALKKALKQAAKTDLKDPALVSPVTTIATHFGNALSYLFSEYKERQNARYREKVTVRRQKENRIQIDLTNSLKLAHSVLTEVAEGKQPNWIDVSCSIALSTGRRMGEIHCSATFSESGEYEIAFRGQLKGKDRKVRVGSKLIPLRKVTFYIPTLLSAELVCLGLEYLEIKGKRLERDSDPERVNLRWAKTLNLAVKDWDIFPESERTYHKFRAAYLRASILNDSNVDPYDFKDYAKEILGDDDETTIDAYKRYEIKPGTLTKL
ncbi:MAG: protelomerase family protein [Scytonema sp. PMC 1069.18]|nr:protelomerase family protein [Scytonema sp. PMC 1069.18]MEC4885003.1 protelomerase family protein [Scytonema sp. PMC 1070.18]